MYGIVDDYIVHQRHLWNYRMYTSKTVINSLNKAILKTIHVSWSGNKTTCPKWVACEEQTYFRSSLRTIRKRMGRGGGAAKYKKKKKKQGKNKWKKIHPCKVDQQKTPALAFHTFCTNLRKAGRKAYCVQNITSLNKLPADFGLVNNHTWYKKIYLRLVSCNHQWHLALLWWTMAEAQ